MNLHIRQLQAEDAEPISAAFHAVDWAKPVSQYQRYFEEQEQGQKIVLVAFADGIFCGYLTIVWETDYPPFRDADIPELRDFNVLPPFQRQGIGSRLMTEAERMVAERSDVVGIGVGMTADYRAAQRLYVLRGYVPDGRGLMSHNRALIYGETVPVDNGLVLYFTRQLR